MPIGGKVGSLPSDTGYGGSDGDALDFKSYLRDRAEKPKARKASMTSPASSPAPGYDVPGFQTSAEGWKAMVDDTIRKYTEAVKSNIESYQQQLQAWIDAGHTAAMPQLNMQGVMPPAGFAQQLVSQFPRGGGMQSSSGSVQQPARPRQSMAQQRRPAPRGVPTTPVPSGGQTTPTPKPLPGPATARTTTPPAGLRGDLQVNPGRRRALGQSNPRNQSAVPPRR